MVVEICLEVCYANWNNERCGVSLMVAESTVLSKGFGECKEIHAGSSRAHTICIEKIAVCRLFS